MGGEKAKLAGLEAGHEGSPPHGRGKDFFRLPNPDGERITPAWAGKSYKYPVGLLPKWDHPRVGGEKRTRPQKTQRGRGSPPRRRGKAVHRLNVHLVWRITPA